MKYFDSDKHRVLVTITGGQNRIIEDVAQVTEDKLAVLYRMKVCIYNIADGKQLFSKELKKLHKLMGIKNKYVIVYFTVGAHQDKEHKLMLIDINDYSTKEIKIEGKVNTAAYLESGFLILGGEKITVLRTDKSSFDMVKSEFFFYDPIKSLLALSHDTFAGASEQKVCIWDSDLKLSHTLSTDRRFVELKALQKDVLLLQTVADTDMWNGIVWFYNFKSGELLKKIKIEFPIHRLFLTPDRVFLQIVGKSKIVFYHLDGEYVYSEFELENRYMFLSESTMVWKDHTFAWKINEDRSVLLFDFEK